jgi:5-methylcytosine-specific restriction endonuclease McrA
VNDKDFIKAVEESNNISNVIRKMNRSAVGSNFKWCKKHIKRLNLDTSHWKKERNPIPECRIHTNEDLFQENSSIARGTVKKRIIIDNLIKYECSNCGISKWNGQDLSLILDHINGISNDHRLENLRFLCPNCNSQTSTFSGRNKKNTLDDYSCNSKHKSKSLPQKFKIEDDYLLSLVDFNKISFTKIAKEYNVSDTTVRKRYNKIKAEVE